MQHDLNDFSTLVKYLPMEVIKHYERQHIQQKQSRNSELFSPFPHKGNRSKKSVGQQMNDSLKSLRSDKKNGKKSSIQGPGSTLSKQSSKSGVVPGMQRCDCVSMFLDVAKFTVLTAELAKYRDGAGQLATALNNLMQCIARRIRSANGDILKFAGDALVIVWPITYSSDNPSEQKYEKSNLQTLVHTTLSLAWGLLSNLEFNTFMIVDPDAPTSALSHTSSVGKNRNVQRN